MRIGIIGIICVLLGMAAQAETDGETWKSDGTWHRHSEHRDAPEVYLPPDAYQRTSRLFLGRQDVSSLPDDVNVVHTEHFRIIWGPKASRFLNRWQDRDGSGYPDYIDVLITEVEHVWQTLVNTHSFQAPRNSDLYYIDVYLANTGLQDPIYTLDPLNMPSRFFGFADNFRDGTPLLALNDSLQFDELKATLAHEFFHTVQFSYKLAHQDYINAGVEKWWFEASAVWAEKVVYPDTEDYEKFIRRWMDYSYKSLFRFDSSHEYGSAIWAHYLSEHFASDSDPEGIYVVRDIWESFKNNSLMESFQNFFANQSIHPELDDFNQVFAHFAETLVNPSSFYEGGADYSSLDITRTITSLPYELATSVGGLNRNPEPLGFQMERIQRNSAANTPLLIHFDGGDVVDSMSVDWQLVMVEQAQDGSYGTPQAFNPGAYQYQGLRVTPNTDWKNLYFLITPLPQNPTSMNTFAKVPFVLSIEEESDTPSDFDVHWQEVVYETRNPSLVVQTVEEHGGIAVPLEQGWNLVGDPFLSQSISLSERFSAVLPYLESAWSWENNNWRFFSPSTSVDEINSIYDADFVANQTLNPTEGVWLNMAMNTTLFLMPNLSEKQPSIDVELGWSLHTSTGDPLSLRGLGLESDRFAQVWWHSDQEWHTQRLHETLAPPNLTAGTGFWLHVQ